MFSQLIQNVAAAARAVQEAAYVPPQLQGLREHAAEFSRSLVPALTAVGARIGDVGRDANTQATQLQPLVAAWKAGDAGAHDRIAASLNALLKRVQTASQDDQSAYDTLSRYRDQCLADQRQVAQVVAELQSRMVGLRSQLDNRMQDLESQQRRLSFLRAMPFMLPWIVAEIASLISSSKTLEQQLSELHNQVAHLNGQFAQTAQAQGLTQSFASQLQLLESSMQQVTNGTSILQGQLTQIVGALQSGQQGTSPIVVEAYLQTLKGQADSLLQYLDA
ncbi:hypothetical protein PQR72_35875 [Paraburkholderia madseniana]|jgi:DNA repair exonuclease SbcCD ATPase subunit|uniref:hypothetical protein n=1 Tax=Paraburkholderia madseniana TaxID=2599607 RepID=UPI0015C556D6|nr:hypothetical protein [Paraburkholderia madseniana]NPT69412.1 hypothetical protein [Paraburkholderia madseniana]